MSVYNMQAYVETCLDSVCSQSLRNIEVICINDGSTDYSSELLNAYACKDSRVRVIHQENAGVSAARNAGINAACGEYILFADSNDTFNSGAFELMYQQVRCSDLDIFFDTDTAYASELLQKEYNRYSNYYHRKLACTDVCRGEKMFVLMRKSQAYRAHCCL